MQLFQTPDGVARRSGSVLELLDVEHDLHQLVVDGDLGRLSTVPVVSALPLDRAALLPPVRPSRLFLVGLNYRSHLVELGLGEPERLIYATADVTDQLTAPGATVTMPADHPDEVDYEAEVGVVIGRRAHQTPVDDAWSVVAGVTACNDVTARDVQRAGLAEGDTTAGKMLPGFLPLGPGLLTGDEAREVPLGIRLTVNGEVRQESDTDDMAFSVPRLVSVISADHELRPGDVLVTGSPAGVGLTTGRYLQDGDVVAVTVGPLPPLSNTFRKG
ncbi:MAG: fumarylacetoacetate hydrolase family protein [Dermatophilaceae bacterium]